MSSLENPRRLGSFDLLGLLATGGMAEIFLAQASDGPSAAGLGAASLAGGARATDPVVIKRVLPHLARESAFRDMFLDEARIVMRIHHPNVVCVHELHDTDEELFLVMEHLDGESLASVLRHLRRTQTELPFEVAAYLAAEAAAGLHAAHELKNDQGLGLEIVHRDVSPHNLFVLRSGTVKVIDFGIAKGTERQAGRTQTGQVKGKFAYMPPEQIGSSPVDRRADIFALGAVLHELITGQKLFDRDHDLLVLKAICEDPIPSPTATRASTPRELDEITMKALRRNRDQRYATAADFERDLRAFAAKSTVNPRELVAAHMAKLLESTEIRVSRQHTVLAKIRETGGIRRSDLAAPRSSPPLIPGAKNAGPSLFSPLDRRFDSSAPTRIENTPEGALELPMFETPKRRKARVVMALGGVVVAGGVLALVLGRGSAPESASAATAAGTSTSAPMLVKSAPAASQAVASARPPAAPSASASAAPSAQGVAGQPARPNPGGVVPPPQQPANGAPGFHPPATAAPTGFTRFE